MSDMREAFELPVRVRPRCPIKKGGSMKVRKTEIDGDLAYVPLTKGYTAIIDAKNAETVGQFNWYASVRDHTVYACRSKLINGKKKTLRMHRVIAGAEDSKEVDHIDHNGLNNIESNLRVCTRGKNCRNVRSPRRSKSQLKGITWHKRDKKWRAQIRNKGEQIHLGSFDNPEDAHEAYRTASLKYHKQYGYSGDDHGEM